MNNVKVISGYIATQITRPKGGSASNNASNIKTQASERLANLMDKGDTKGVENLDALKKGIYTPEKRIVYYRKKIDDLNNSLKNAKYSLAKKVLQEEIDLLINKIIDIAKDMQNDENP